MLKLLTLKCEEKTVFNDSVMSNFLADRDTTMGESLLRTQERIVLDDARVSAKKIYGFLSRECKMRGAILLPSARLYKEINEAVH
jgi:hypothetical protein